eukprot:SAG22_NODE_301_length_12744_cov_19.648189_4_plen_82_part_00
MPPKPKLKFRSPAEFFAENKNIAGFDNPGKSLYTTIRELVENGACQAAGRARGAENCRRPDTCCSSSRSPHPLSATPAVLS